MYLDEAFMIIFGKVLRGWHLNYILGNPRKCSFRNTKQRTIWKPRKLFHYIPCGFTQKTNNKDPSFYSDDHKRSRFNNVQ